MFKRSIGIALRSSPYVSLLCHNSAGRNRWAVKVARSISRSVRAQSTGISIFRWIPSISARSPAIQGVAPHVASAEHLVIRVV